MVLGFAAAAVAMLIAIIPAGIVLGLACLGGVLALIVSRLLRNPSVWLRSATISIMVALGS